MVYVLALAAALLFGIGSAAQQRVAARAPEALTLRFSLLWYLFRQPPWLVGVATALVGNVLGGSALGMGSVALVQPLLVTRLLFALPVSAVWNRRPMNRREWAAAFAVVGGLAAFLVAGSPQGDGGSATRTWQWVLAAGAIASITYTLVQLARRLRPSQEAPVLAIGAGMLFGLQSALTQTAVHELYRHGLLAMLSFWAPYAVAVVAILGTLLSQSAYKLAPLPVSYPPMAAMEPIAGIAIGVGVLGSSLRLAPIPLTVELLGVGIMTYGIYLLAASPALLGEERIERHRREHEERRNAE